MLIDVLLTNFVLNLSIIYILELTAILQKPHIKGSSKCKCLIMQICISSIYPMVGRMHKTVFIWKSMFSVVRRYILIDFITECSMFI